MYVIYAHIYTHIFAIYKDYMFFHKTVMYFQVIPKNVVIFVKYN